MNRSRIILVAAVVAAVLAGCADRPGTELTQSATPPALDTPTPTPTPTPSASLVKPALDELVLSADGIGPLVVGTMPPVVDPALDVLVYDEDFCQWAVDEDLRTPDQAGLWVPNYPIDDKNGPGPFGVSLNADGTLAMMRPYSEEIATAEGVHLHSTLAELVAAYPTGLQFTEGGGGFDEYRLLGSAADLVFDVISPDGVQYYPEYGGEVVFQVFIVPKGAYQPPLGGSDYGFVGVCSGP